MRELYRQAHAHPAQPLWTISNADDQPIPHRRTPYEPPAVAVRNVLELAADYGIQFG